MTSALSRTLRPTILLLASLLGVAAACDQSAQAAPEKEAEPAGHLHFRMVTRFGFGGSIYHAPEFFFMLPENRVYRGVPPEGLERFDYDAMRESDPKNTGTYQIANGTMTIQWADERTSSYRYARKGEHDFTLDDLHTGRVRAFAGGQTLDGRWTHTAAVSGAGQSASSSQTLALRPDGTFRESSLSALSLRAAGESVVSDAESAGEGRYHLAGNTLTLNYADGRIRRFSAFPFGDGSEGPSPEFFNLNGRMLKLEKS